MVENLLSITRIGDARAQITKQPEVVEEILGEVVQKFRKRFPDVSIRVAAPSDLLFVPMDAILIEQVLSNLLENAVIHGETTTNILLSVHQEGKYACFSVQDNGKGIPPKELPTLFDGSMKRNETPAGDGKRNMGLGLSVCMAIDFTRAQWYYGSKKYGSGRGIFFPGRRFPRRNLNEYPRKNPDCRR